MRGYEKYRKFWPRLHGDKKWVAGVLPQAFHSYFGAVGSGSSVLPDGEGCGAGDC